MTLILKQTTKEDLSSRHFLFSSFAVSIFFVRLEQNAIRMPSDLWYPKPIYCKKKNLPLTNQVGFSFNT